MNEDKNNKIKTSLVITIFIIIILLSAYVVVDKVISKEKLVNLDKIKINKTNNNKITNDYLEVNNYDDTFYKLSNYIDDDTLSKLYKYKNKALDFDVKSYITTKNISESDKIIEEISYIDKEIFEKKYSEIFGNIDSNKITNMCNASSYDNNSDSYIINSSCSDNNYLFLTFFKNATHDFKEQNLTINKYYVFVNKTSSGYVLYKDEDFKSIIVENIKYEDIKNYIYKMNIISTNFKKDKLGNYYIDSVK